MAGHPGQRHHLKAEKPATEKHVNAYVPPTWPVPVKGVAFDATGRVLLLHNERGEWELPGGRLEPADPSPERTVEREFEKRRAGRLPQGRCSTPGSARPSPDAAY
ncbi:NUDIX domain-containing protein [Streptomyces hiroshimensis]